MNGPLLVTIAGTIVVLTLVAWLLVMHGMGRVNLLELVTAMDADGVVRASLSKIGQCIAIVVTTFTTVYMTVHPETATEWTVMNVILYGVMWSGSKILGQLATAKAGAITAVNTK